jgi:hypothetical protein
MLGRLHELCGPTLLPEENLLRNDNALHRTHDLLPPKPIPGAFGASKLDPITR